jgi:Holliday junction resolvase RusA-like endonuclease
VCVQRKREREREREKKQRENKVCFRFFLKKITQKKYKKINGYVEINYKFYVKNFKMCDVGNFEKPLNDILVKGELIDDDRFIKRMILEKFQSDNEYMEIKIKKV